MNAKYFNKCTKPFGNPINITGTVTDITTVNGNDGSIVVNVDGGATPYTYLWSSDETIPGDNTKDYLNGLSSGYYTIQVTDDNDNVSEKRFKVNGLQPITANIITQNIITSGDTENDTSDNESEILNILGSINVKSISGGKGLYSVKLEGPQTNTEVYNIPFNHKFEGLIEGAYVITITDELLSTKVYTRNITIDE